MKTILLRCFSAAALILAPSVAVTGPQSPADCYTDMSLEQLMNIPVYAASKRPQPRAQAPSSVTVITAQDIQAYGWRTFGDILRSVPGFYVDYPRSYGYVGIRGFGRPWDLGARMLLLVNGHCVNDQLYDGAAIMEDFILDLDSIDRIEIVRGPGSALYGNNALFAVINVITQQGGGPGRVDVSGEAGTYGTYRARTAYQGQTTNGTDFIMSASGFTSDGNPHVHFRHTAELERGEDETFRSRGEDAHRFSGSIRQDGATLEGFYVGRNNQHPPFYAASGTAIDTFDGRGFIEGRLDNALSENANLKTRLYYDWYEYKANYPFDFAEEGQLQNLVINRDECAAESIGGEVQINWIAYPGHNATAGAEFRYDYRLKMDNFDISPKAEYLDLNIRKHTIGVYAQDIYQIRTNLSFTAGVRCDRQDQADPHLTPRLACIYQPGADTSLKLLYGTAFRAPNVNEFYYEDDGLTTKRNPNLKSEKVTTYEMVLEQQFGHQWNGSVATFYNHVDNLIDVTLDPDDNLSYADNVSEAIARGIELELSGQLAKRIRTYASYTYTQTENLTDGTALGNAPTHLAKLNITSPLIRDWLSIGGEIQYVGARTMEPAGLQFDDVILVNATLLSKRILDTWELSCSVYNVFDESYVATKSEVEADGRTWLLKARAAF